MFQNAKSQKTVEQLPSHFFGTATNHDAEAHGRSITGWHASYEHVGREAFRGEITELRVWPIQIFFEHLDQPCIWRGAAWRGALVFMSVGALRGKFSVSGRAVTPSTVTVLPSDLPDGSFNSAALDSISIAVKESALAEYAERMLDRPISPESLRRSFVVIDRAVVDTFHACVATILRELSAMPALLDDAGFCMRLKDKVMNMLVQVLAVNTDATQQMSAPSTRSYIVEKAIQYIDTRLADAFEMVDLCQAIRVCPRTLRYSFQEVMGVSPTHYLLATRLARVRQALLHAGAASQVQFIAARYGFSHMGRFARYYSDTYGERPSDTLKRNDLQSASTSGQGTRERAGLMDHGELLPAA